MQPNIDTTVVGPNIKKLWTAPKENLQIAGISFGVFSETNINQLSSTQITSSSIYNPDTLLPAKSGPLDPRLGVSGGAQQQCCQTCKLSPKDCVGHFGHIDLVLPCFHIGYIKDVIQMLRMICKSCSRLLLSPAANTQSPTSPNYWRQRMNARISRRQYQILLKKLIEECKKKKRCDYCGEINGAIKKHTKSFRILHHKYKPYTTGDEDTIFYLELFDNISDYHNLHFPKKINEFQRSVNTNTMQDLMPWDVRALFENILPIDYGLIGLRFAKHCPEDLILTKLPVPPCILRPGAKLEDDKANDDDLTVQLSQIVQTNNDIRYDMEKGSNVSTIIENFFYLNKKISEYFIADLPGYPMGPSSRIGPGGMRIGGLAGTKTTATKGKKIRSFSDRLKGKFGRFRGNLSGKRVNFSGRTVISPDPNLDLDELGVPRDVCKLLTFPEWVNKHNMKRMRKLIMNGPDTYPGAVTYGQKCGNGNQYKEKSLKRQKFRTNIVNKLLKYGDYVERHLMYGDIVLFNRQPSLHRVSIMAHRVKPVPFRTFRFNPCCCNPYNADFDGDEMNIHAPQTLMAKAEASVLMNVTSNFCAPKSAEPLVVPLQDIITATYLLTLKRMFFDKCQMQQLVGFMDNCAVGIHTKYDIPMPCILKPIRLWSGKQVFSMILRPNSEPQWPVINLESEARNYGKHKYMDSKDGFVVIRNSELMLGNIDKNTLGSKTEGLFFRLLRDYGPVHTAKCMIRLTKVSTRFLQLYGFSIGIGDVTATEKLKAIQNNLMQNGYAKCDTFLKEYNNGTLQPQPGCSKEVTLEAKMNQTLSQIREDAGKKCVQNLSYYHNAPLIMAECGSKGSKINISQMVSCVGQQTVGGSRVKNQFIERTLPHYTKEHNRTAKAKGFVQNSFFTGITATEFFFHTMGGREGLVDTAVKTAETGYMQRRLMKNIEDVSIEYDFTVRNCKKQIISFLFGHDGIDPMYCESKKNVINFEAILTNVRAQRPRTKHKKLNILSPQMMLNIAKEYIFSHIGKEMEFVRRNITYVDTKCELQFENSLYSWFYNQIYLTALTYGVYTDHWYVQLYGLSKPEIIQFINVACESYLKCVMEPGSAVGGVSATSLGEPATQMTLKTFHFAGVASMNITQGVPRIREIINATPNIKTPVMTVQLFRNDSSEIARIIKARIDHVTVGEVCRSISHVIRPNKAYIECELDLVLMSRLYLSEMTNTAIAIIISQNLSKVLPKIKGHRILQKSVRIATKNKDLIRVQPRGESINAQILGIILNHLMNELPNIRICGIPKVQRALIHQKTVEIKGGMAEIMELHSNDTKIVMIETNKDKRECFVTNVDEINKVIDVEMIDTKEMIHNLPLSLFERYEYQLYIEGKECFLDVINVSGVNAYESVSNDIIEVRKVLGIEAAMQTIINELTKVYSSHGLNVDIRHLMLVSDLMTYTGNVLGFTRHGMMGKEDKSILTMASYEETVKHLFQAALHGETTQIRGVSDSIIVGKPIPIGTGACQVLRNVDRVALFGEDNILPRREPLILGECPLKAMTNNNFIVTKA